MRTETWAGSRPLGFHPRDGHAQAHFKELTEAIMYGMNCKGAIRRLSKLLDTE